MQKLASTRVPIWLLGLWALLLLSCNKSKDLERMRAENDALMKRVEALEHATARRGPDPNRIYAPNLAGSHVRGPAEALVTLVAFSDFECPFCRAASATVEELRARYADQLRVVFMHHPLDMHARALPAAVAAECAGEQGRFWEMHDRLFSLSSLDGQDFTQLGKAIGLAEAPFEACRSSERPKQVVAAHREQLRALSIKSAPVFFVNGHLVRGAASRAKFETLIDAELEKARKSGLAADEYYRKEVEQRAEKVL
jgi:protein-disulfide isomerase